MNTNFGTLNANIRIFCQKVTITGNKSLVFLTLLDPNNIDYRLEIKRSRIVDKNFDRYLIKELSEFDIDLSPKDIEKIADKVKGVLNAPAINLNEQVRLGEVLKRLYQAALDKQPSLFIPLCVENGYLYIRHALVRDVQKVLDDHGGDGWDQRKFKRELKTYGLLVTNKTSNNDTYVYSVYSLGKSKVNQGEQPIKFLKIPLDKLKEFCEGLEIELEDVEPDNMPDEGNDKEVV